jgi:hypothetical protein
MATVRSMPDLQAQISGAIACARRRDWAGYAERFGAARDAVLRHADYGGDEALRRQLDMLSAAAPQHDPEGCIAELEALAEALRRRGAAASAAPAAPPLDLRGLQPPEPIWRILAALDREPRAPLRVVLPHEPEPLYPMLRERGLRWSGALRPDGGYELLIEKF